MFRLSAFSLFFITSFFLLSSCQTAQNHTRNDAPVSDSTMKENQPRSHSTDAKLSNIESKSKDNKINIIIPQHDNDAELTPRGFDLEKQIRIITFGSCADQNKPQPIWKTIESVNSDLFIFMGDNVYASQSENKPISLQYKKLNRIDEFRSFREKTPFLATWDDHDYGKNDGGSDWSEKEEAKKDFLKQWPYIYGSLAPKQKGIYHSKIFGNKKELVQFIVLDTRWFRSPLKKNPDQTDSFKRYLPVSDPNSTLLGESQWQWLEKELKKKADIKFIISSIQFVANDHSFEKWGLFPKEKERFFSLIKKTGVKNLFILSGDRHLGTIAKEEVKGWGPLYDITASSLNLPVERSEKDKTYIGNSFGGENFGIAHINWNKRLVTFEIRDLNNKVINEVSVKLKK